MRTIVAIAIMALVGLLAGLTLYILARRAMLAWVARMELRRRARLEAALEAWAAAAPDAVPPQLARLRRWPDRRLFVALCLERLPAAAPVLRARLVAWLDAQGLLDHWIRQLRARDAWRREQAAEMLGIAQAPRTVDALIRALDDPALDVRMRAARALGEFGGARARRALLDALTDENRWSSIRIADLLADMGHEVLQDVLDAFPTMGRGARLAAVDVVARVGGAAMGPFFVSLLADPDADIRARAAAALGRVDYAGAAPQLLIALDDSEWPVRAMAAKSLGALGYTPAIQRLCHALRDHEWWVRANAAEALRGMGPAGLEALRTMRDDSDAFARDQAAAMLERQERVA